MKTFTQIINEYIKQQCEEDELFKAHLPEDNKEFNKAVDMCCKYIISCAQKVKSGNSAVVEDATVYQWARDYFNDGYYEKESAGQKVTPNVEARVETGSVEDAIEEAKQKVEKRKAEKTKAKPVKEKKAEKNPNTAFEQMSLFDF